uniref:DUF4218 domain-containing protein n=1 Tax=Cannabis sativa TaxID=3483 RepID=A0A803NJS8_CANSA
MVHLALHLPREAILGAPVHMRWMYPFERAMSVYKKYVRNLARPEGSIAEAYIVNEALTFCSMYFRDIETRFNRPDRNQDGVVKQSYNQLSVFKHVGRAFGKQEVIVLKPTERKKAEWFVTEKRDINHRTQNSGIGVPGIGATNFYGVLEDIIEMSYLRGYNVLLFKCKWYDTRNRNIQEDGNFTSVFVRDLWCQDDPFILASQAQMVFYTNDDKNGSDCRLAHKVSHRNIWNVPNINVDAQEDENYYDIPIFQEDNSSNFLIWIELPALDNMQFHPYDDAEAEDVNANVDELLQVRVNNKVLVDDDDFEDDTLGEYEDEKSHLEDDDDTSDYE